MINTLSKPLSELSTLELSDLCAELNSSYRSGSPIVNDDAFDIYIDELAKRDPENVLVAKPQPTDPSKGRIAHSEPMLSTLKAYTKEEVVAYIKRCEKAAFELGVSGELIYKLSWKLDGIAARLVPSKNHLISRGDGDFGSQIHHLVEGGLVIKGDSTVESVGEIVMTNRYFNENLADKFSHPRNVVSGMAGSKNYNEHAKKALEDGAVHLVIYRDMPCLRVSGEEIQERLDELVNELESTSPYPLDGVVIELVDEKLKTFMGKTRHHNVWQLAKKSQGETAITKVNRIAWQVSRSGRVTPVLNINPVGLSGAIISNVTAHHAGYIIKNKIGIGAEVEVSRSGEIIPKIFKIIKETSPLVPSNCPCCDHELELAGDFLVCNGANCSAQAVGKIIHHFKTIQCDNFGDKSVEKLVSNGFDTIEKIHLMTTGAFESIGFGAGQAMNLVSELERVKGEPLKDNLLLASLGISKLGRGASEKLLAEHRITDLSNITAKQIESINGFGRLTSESISNALKERDSSIQFLLNLNFNLSHTQDNQQNTDAGGSLSGIRITFTGKMKSTRSEMSADAQSKGAIVLSSCNRQTNILCCGERVGSAKIDSAKKNGVKIISEAEYWEKYSA